ncbi:hypothetical protein [Actinokineospora inagensis]|uniref:hypothetical protein n=1 Tax=Actinokineospora inagensis TaxID=103730 RepID=UPI000413A8F7|nr:hypothetical protein [Actinokineospora inagensis]
MSNARRWARLPVAIAALALAACSSDAGSGDGTETAHLGNRITIRSSSSPTLASLWLESVAPVDCTEPGSLPASSGHYLAATIVLQTTEQYTPDSGWWMSAADFTTEDSGGKVTGHGIVTSCLPENRYLPDDFYLSDSGYYGVVLIDSASVHGTVTYKPHNLPNDVAGWHWDY